MFLLRWSTTLREIIWNINYVISIINAAKLAIIISL